ncbi:hypothetical protein C8J45_101338 [Sphingomonas sp. PP-CE-3G-477]|uniref:hypothetical protein n=1 Tax=Sphingomonas sp. PP-CE-3G-477 TaxID=2135660 RepID=UPI000D4DD353|nr:hypothetical protein [Sphingomonas sp. PP-CE-3G-477]PTQ65491.1 hypothetical protein C8J45_101338 [Sphingomonas sp. PP-CE-3G-477]
MAQNPTLNSDGIAVATPATIDREAQSQLLAAIDAKIGEVRTEAIDLSFGEIIN